MDAKKADGGSGDLLIWKTILQEGKTQRKDFIFVTVDEKQDWWVRNHGAFQPRIELLEEYRSFTGGHSIHITRLSHLLKIYAADEKAINEIKRIEEANTAHYILEANTGRYVLFGGVSREQAAALANDREIILAELARIEKDIATLQWSLDVLLSDDFKGAEANQHRRVLADLVRRREECVNKIGRIDRQLVLTPPDVAGRSNFSGKEPSPPSG